MGALPKRTHYKNGSFYFVHKNKWTRLSYFRDEAIALATERNALIDEGITNDAADYLRKIHRSWKGRAKSRNLAVEISIDDIIELGKKQKWRCAITQIRFDILKLDGKRRMPYAPSVDRIDSAGGYTKDNVRLVCLATNLALNEWGDSVFMKIAEGYLKSRISGLC